ncbi:hypothetical protein JD969_11500 [Planctomycetota bacterium]|nr:hypothetical protein JD969_11500 [Planctomycetota bacterium]
MINTLAQSAKQLDPSQSIEVANNYSVLIFYIITLGVFGIVSIVAVTFIWHRYRKRIKKLQATIEDRRENSTPLASAWESAADRLDTKQVLAEYSEVDELTDGSEIDNALEADYDEQTWADGNWSDDSENPDSGNLEDPDDPENPDNPDNQGPRLW